MCHGWIGSGIPPLYPQWLRLPSCIYNHLRTRHLNFYHPYRQEVIQHSLFAAIYDFSVIYDKYTLVINESEQDSYLTKFIDLLFRHYKQHWKTGFYSDKLNIPPQYLSKIIKEETGNSVQDWMFQLVLFETKCLLRSTKMSIAEIAEHFNFPDSASFGKFFKKHVDMTPVEYRGMSREVATGNGIC
jgi:AraC family transcriptional regulator, transcriptional activator of pobA